MTQLTANQLRKAADLKEKIEKLQSELDQLLGHFVGNGSPAKTVAPKKKRKMSAAARAKISTAQKARWAKQKR